MKEDYVIYEYISVNVKSDLEPRYIDCYEKFGWIHINNTIKKDYYINSNPDPNTVEIKFKRDRRIRDKEELQKLQAKCEKAYLIVDKLEKMPKSLATIYSLTIGFIATIFMAISIFAIMSKMWFLAILCGIIEAIGYILPYFVYRKVKNKKEVENKNKIDEQQNIIYDTCKKARKILSEL